MSVRTVLMEAAIAGMASADIDDIRNTVWEEMTLAVEEVLWACPVTQVCAMIRTAIDDQQPRE